MKTVVTMAVLVALAACAPKEDAGTMADTAGMMTADTVTMMVDSAPAMMDSNMVDSAMARDTMAP